MKKPKLDNHFGKCHSPFTCVDCSKTFGGPKEWKSHTSCISEAEKYQKSLYKGKKNVCACSIIYRAGDLTQPRSLSRCPWSISNLMERLALTATSSKNPTPIVPPRPRTRSRNQKKNLKHRQIKGVSPRISIHRAPRHSKMAIPTPPPRPLS